MKKVHNHKLIKFFEGHKYAKCLKVEDVKVVSAMTNNSLSKKTFS